MLGDFTRNDWLSTLRFPEDRIPQVLILRGTRNLEHWLENYRQYFDDVKRVETPNLLIDHVFTAKLDGVPVGYASVYGGAMASEIVHLFGILGTKIVIQTGNCGAFADDVRPGDLFVPTAAFCGEGAAQYYTDNMDVVCPQIDFEKYDCLRSDDEIVIHQGRIYTTAALFAETERQIQQWRDDGFAAVDMETATTFAVARRFNMDSVSVLFVFDNPLRKDDATGIHETDASLDERRNRGNERCTEVVLALAREYVRMKRM